MPETYTSGTWTVKAKDQPDFRERIMRVRSHCEDFQPSTLELVVTVD
jgi:hypothetical protein